MPFTVLAKLDARVSDLRFEEKLSDFPHVLDRCQNIFSLYEETRKELNTFATQLEQLKGFVKGLELSQTVAGQHTLIFNEKCKRDEITKEEFKEKSSIVNLCVQSLKDTHQDKKGDLNRAAGKFDGVVLSANRLLDRIERNISNLESQLGFMEDNSSFEEEMRNLPARNTISTTGYQDSPNNGASDHK